MPDPHKIKRALISVFDKIGVVELAGALEKLGIEIISTGGTLKKIKEAGIQVISVAAYTGSPEIMDGRVKTLHPKVHAGLLYRRGDSSDEADLARIEAKGIDLVVVNLYPFEQTLAKEGVSHDEIIENIDIGGPTMLRSAAKNYSSVTVVCDPADYDDLVAQLTENQNATDMKFREKLATKVFTQTSRYDTAISGYLESLTDQKEPILPEKITASYLKQAELRYGENPHQPAAVYKTAGASGVTLLDGEILSGKELSYNNYGDLDACLEMLLDFDQPFACLLKHANPCGAATAENLTEAYRKAYATDPLSAFGCIIGLNQPVDLETAELVHETHFVECILAPEFSPEALKLLKKKKSRRILALPGILSGRSSNETAFKFIRGGTLLQAADSHILDPSTLKLASKREPSSAELKDLLFAWKVVKHTKSNAIVMAAGEATVGIGMGQTSRVDSAFMAVKRAGDRAKGSVVASDAFYPMPDGVEVALEAGATAIIQPGGSKGDEAVTEAVDKAGAAMVFTGIRHFRH